MKTSIAMVFGAVPLLTTGVAFAQDRNMMNGGSGMAGYGWMGGDFGGVWVQALVVVVLVAFVAWIVKQKGK